MVGSFWIKITIALGTKYQAIILADCSLPGEVGKPRLGWWGRGLPLCRERNILWSTSLCGRPGFCEQKTGEGCLLHETLGMAAAGEQKKHERRELSASLIS